ncbi:hypothetical protein BD770DRAFT_414550 [Pilaira anomala]|nr:hypothetical protein BD770DRAFT_414550 [Pilaira anomala]
MYSTANLKYEITEKEGIAFFFFTLCFITIICYDYHISCYLKKTLCFCTVWCRKKNINWLGLPTEEQFSALKKENKKLKEEAKSDEAVIECLLNRIESLEYALNAEIRFRFFEFEKLKEDFEDSCKKFEMMCQ